MSKEQEHTMTISNIQKVAQLFTLKVGCWYDYLEKQCGNPFQYDRHEQYYNPCKDSYPFCTMQMNKYVKPISRHGMSTFLGSTFFTPSNQPLTPLLLSEKLFNFENVGTLVYG